MKERINYLNPGSFTMKTPCEIVVRKILPQIRAIVSIRLKEEYNLKGKDIARLVGTTEAAVSQYLHGIRGVNTTFSDDFPETIPFAEEAAKKLYDNRDTEMELTEMIGEICKRLRKNENFIELYTNGKSVGACGICFNGI